MREPWFGVKAYGIGIGPKSRAGWVSVAVYCVLMVAAPLAMHHLYWPAWSLPAAFVFLTLVLLTLMFVKSDGQPLRWRWDGR